MSEPLDQARMWEQLVLHEGLYLTPYKCPSGKWTILVGYNYEDRGLQHLSRALGRTVTLQGLRRGLTRADAERQVAYDVAYFEVQVRARFPLYDRLNDPRKRAVIDFVFNLGTTRAASFRRARAALELALVETNARPQQAYYYETAWHAMDSLWSRQVDDGMGGTYGRADRLCEMLITGRDYVR